MSTLFTFYNCGKLKTSTDKYEYVFDDKLGMDSFSFDPPWGGSTKYICVFMIFLFYYLSVGGFKVSSTKKTFLFVPSFPAKSVNVDACLT